MGRVGNQDEALAALLIVYGLEDPRDDEVRSEGWTRVGRGKTRIAMRGPSGTVYKVPSPFKVPWEKGKRHNRREAERFTLWDGRDFVAEWHLYEVTDTEDELVPIMAMEYVEADGTEPTNLDALRAALEEVGDEDLHPENYRVRAGRAIILDAAGWSCDEPLNPGRVKWPL